MTPRNQMQSQELIVVKIQQVDIANRIAHCVDKTNSPIQVSFRDAPGGIYHIPAQDEKWTAKRLGYTWYLADKQDSLDEHLWSVDNMDSGDTRISADGTLHILAPNLEVNGIGIAPTYEDFFYSPTAGFDSVQLSAVPTSRGSIQVFLNGLLASGTIWNLVDSTITFLPTMAAGYLVVYYQTANGGAIGEGTTNDDFVVIGRGLVSGIEQSTTSFDTAVIVGKGKPSALESRSRDSAATIVGIAVISGIDVKAKIYTDAATPTGVAVISGTDTKGTFYTESATIIGVKVVTAVESHTSIGLLTFIYNGSAPDIGAVES